MLKLSVAGAIAAAVISGPAVAQTTQPSAGTQQPASGRAAGNMNDRVCETIKPIGSRLATKKFCGTRAEWAERKRLDREALEQAQKGPCMVQTTTGSGRPSC